MTKESWNCQYWAEAHGRDGRKRILRGTFDGLGDVVGKCEQILNQRLRKPYFWLGVGITILTPLHNLDYVIEEKHSGVRLEKL